MLTQFTVPDEKLTDLTDACSTYYVDDLIAGIIVAILFLAVILLAAYAMR